MALRTVRAEASFVLVVIFVTSNALKRRVLETLGCVTRGALQRLVRADKGEGSQAMIEAYRRAPCLVAVTLTAILPELAPVLVVARVA